MIRTALGLTALLAVTAPAAAQYPYPYSNPAQSRYPVQYGWQRSAWQPGFAGYGDPRFNGPSAGRCGPRYDPHAVLYRTCSRGPWQTYGVYASEAEAERVECQLQRQGYRAKVRDLD